jgi:hypothetical protein
LIFTFIVFEIHFHKDLKYFAKKVDALAKISEKLKEILTKNLLPVNIQTNFYQIKHNDNESRKLPFYFLPTLGTLCPGPCMQEASLYQ